MTHIAMKNSRMVISIMVMGVAAMIKNILPALSIVSVFSYSCCLQRLNTMADMARITVMTVPIAISDIKASMRKRMYIVSISAYSI